MDVKNIDPKNKNVKERVCLKEIKIMLLLTSTFQRCLMIDIKNSFYLLSENNSSTICKSYVL